MPDIESVLEAKLDTTQAAAASDTGREILSLACAGSGKSRTLAYRVARLLATGETASSIVAFTFTEKAAEAIKRRVAEALIASDLDVAQLASMYVGTIHGFCQNVLGELDARYRQFDVLDDNRLILFLISRYPALGIQALRAQHPTSSGQQARYFEAIKETASAWKTLNDELLRIEDVNRLEPVIGQVMENLALRLNEDQFVDFSTMIRKVVDALVGNDWQKSATLSAVKHLFVDEYQDVNPAQEAIISAIHSNGASLFVVGDDDQAIYGWRGADVRNILTFQQRYSSRKHTLSHNYRSTKAIVAAADGFASAALGANRLTKFPTADDPPGPRDFRRLFFADRPAEAEWVASRIKALLGTKYQEKDGSIRGLTPGDFAILMRSTRSQEQSGAFRHTAFTEALSAAGVDFTLEAGGGAFGRLAVRALAESFNLLRSRSPTREEVQVLFDTTILPAFPHADFSQTAAVFAEWGRLVHMATDQTRRRVFPQKLVHDLLAAFEVASSTFSHATMRDIGLFSRIMQDVEAVYLSVDSTARFAEILNFLAQVAEEGYDTSTDEVVSRPDAVSVMTVHKAKGLEFPVVFVVDVEQGRFPTKRSNYKGWLPMELLQNAIQRGAYGSTLEGEARLFYTALTRAERFLYVTGAAQLPAGRRQATPSTFSGRLLHAEISTVPNELPQGLEQAPPIRRIEETEIPTTFSEIRYYLLCPRDYQFRKRFNFSPPIPELFGFGRTVHTAIGRLHQENAASAPTTAEAERVTLDTFHLKHIAPSRNPETNPGPYERAKASAAGVVRGYVQEFGSDFAQERQVEARFEIPSGKAVISGTIDLLLRKDSRGQVLDAKVVDFKSMEAGEDAARSEDYDWTELSLQVQLYAKGAHKVLGEHARTGAVHFLKDGQRVEVPVYEEAIRAALLNVEWAVARIEAGDFPMRPATAKCGACDFAPLCRKEWQEFQDPTLPPAIHTPAGQVMARAFREV